MRRGFVAGAVVGAVLSIGLGALVAVLPTTPTWALWRIKNAADADDYRALGEMVDLNAVVQRGLAEVSSEDGREDALDLGKVALALLSGGKVVTVFNDPEHPLEITAGDVLNAWWGMRRDGDLAYVTLPAGDRTIDVVLGRGADLRWRIVGVTPLDALIRVRPGRRDERTTTRPSGVDALRRDG
jgi:hypothetical protein